MRTATTGWMALAIGATALMLPLAGWAQPAPTTPGTSAANPPAAPTTPTATPPGGIPSNPNDTVQATVRNENGRRVYVASTVIDVRGEIQRPYAFSVSGRSSLGYTYFEQPIHFVQEVLDAVRRAPFKP